MLHKFLSFTPRAKICFTNCGHIGLFGRKSSVFHQSREKAFVIGSNVVPSKDDPASTRHNCSSQIRGISLSRNKWNYRDYNEKNSDTFGVRSAVIGLGLALLCVSKKAECEGEPFSLVIDSRGAKKTLTDAINDASDLVQRIKDEVGSPGLVIAVNVNGKEVWSEGLGYADVENRVRCHPNTVIRIASISKSMTMTIAGKLMEQGKLDIDKDVKAYVKDWPEKQYDGKKVDITTRQLVSHQAGVRHYSTICETEDNNRKTNKAEDNKEKEKKDEFENREYYLKKKFTSVLCALKLFKDDPLHFMPGTGFLYTTHGWTLISAVLEGASGKKFTYLAQKLFKDLGLFNTYLDENTPIIYNRASNYLKNSSGRLENAPYVDNSYKWAGGGFLSTMPDLCRFGDTMLYSAQSSTAAPGYLKAETMRTIWRPVKDAPCGWDADGHYAMGWCSIPAAPQHRHSRIREYVSHTGGAVGASSVLLVMPSKESGFFSAAGSGDGCGEEKGAECLPRGVTVAIAVNMQGVGLNKVALQIANIFDETLD